MATARIMITDGTGFIGERLTQALIARSFDVIHLHVPIAGNCAAPHATTDA